MDQPVPERVSRPVSGTKHLKRVLEQRAREAREDRARWETDHPNREPGTSTRTWKSESKQRFPSRQYTRNYDLIDWGFGNADCAVVSCGTET